MKCSRAGSTPWQSAQEGGQEARGFLNGPSESSRREHDLVQVISPGPTAAKSDIRKLHRGFKDRVEWAEDWASSWCAYGVDAHVELRVMNRRRRAKAPNWPT